MEIPDNVEIGYSVERIFFYWLAAHHKNETVPPIWLSYRYERYTETVEPIGPIFLLDSGVKVNPNVKLKLPPERIKDHYNQPTAVVLQKDDLLVLLDEFLSLIATP